MKVKHIKWLVLSKHHIQNTATIKDTSTANIPLEVEEAPVKLS